MGAKKIVEELTTPQVQWLAGGEDGIWFDEEIPVTQYQNVYIYRSGYDGMSGSSHPSLISTPEKLPEVDVNKNFYGELGPEVNEVLMSIDKAISKMFDSEWTEESDISEGGGGLEFIGSFPVGIQLALTTEKATKESVIVLEPGSDKPTMAEYDYEDEE
jgi:hypothetical protein